VAVPVLADQDIQAFEDRGYLVAREVIPEAVTRELRERILTRVADNRGADGWKESLVLLHDCFGPEEWQRVQTPRLEGALNQLLGQGRWRPPHGFGSWPVLFPGFSDPPWHALDISWHVEGRSYEHWLDSPEIGVTMIMLFSDIGPGDGGTAVAAGSHRVVARILARSRRGLAQMELTGAYLRECADAPIVETHGRAGDILFMHPFTVHATSANIGQAVRVACNCRVALHEPLRTGPAADAVLSPVERAIAAAIEPSLGTS
jgi:hypothetical protein